MLEKLLLSINHYLRYSRNLNETSENLHNNELEYISHQNKQNINTVHNNKNKINKKN